MERAVAFLSASAHYIFSDGIGSGFIPVRRSCFLRQFVDTAIIVVSVAAITVVQQPVHQENQQLVSVR